MKILFMGTPDFAAVSLSAIARTGENIVGVITQPDKPRGRGYTLMPTPVKTCAIELGVPVFTPSSLKGDSFAELLTDLCPDLIIVAAYGKILPKNVLEFPKYGCINAHASLLPKYRGAAPIQRAIMNGETETGVTAMYMDEGLDTGDIILTKSVAIDLTDNFESVHDKLASAGAEAMADVISGIRNGTLTRTPQPGDATYAAKIEDADMRLDFSRSARDLFNQIRGLSPIPLTYTFINGKTRLRVIAAEYDETDSGTPVGTVVSVKNGKISVSTGDGTLHITHCQPDGGRKMTAADMVNGRRIAVGDVLTV